MGLENRGTLSSPVIALRVSANFSIGGRKWPLSSLSMRQVLRCATARSTTAQVVAYVEGCVVGVECGLSGSSLDWDQVDADMLDVGLGVQSGEHVLES